jgi:hypothetical protein
VLNLHHTTVRAMRGTGRAIFNAGTLTLTDSRLTTGAQASGGGIQNDGTLTLLRSSIEGARAATGINPGGAVLNIGSLTATCSKFINNEASQGGAIYNGQGGQLGAENNLFLGNKANGGGAIFNALANPTLILPNNFFGAGGAPAVDEYYAGTDTISQRLSVTPLAVSDPTASAACAATPPLPAPASGLSKAGLSALRAPELSVFEQPDLIPQALSYRDNNNVLSVLLPNGQSVAEPSLNSAEVFDTPRWLPDGSKVAYASNQSGNMEIFVLDLASGQTINLSNDADSEDSYPVWSSDGSRVMFGVQREGIRIVSVLGRFTGQAAIGAGDAGSNIIIDPGQPTDVFIARPYIWGTFRPVWAANQAEIYYGVDGSVYSVDMNNMQAESRVIYTSPGILPDGEYARFAGGTISPSPTGSDILFSAELYASDNTYLGNRIYLMGADGSGLRSVVTGVNAGAVHRSAAWFPDGQYALFAEREAAPYNFYKVAAYTGGPRTLVFSSGHWSRPAWRPALQGQVATPTSVPDTAFPITYYVTCQDDQPQTINFREMPSGNLITQIPENTALVATNHYLYAGINGFLVSYNGTNGWVASYDPSTGRTLLYESLSAAGCPEPTATPTPTATPLPTLPPAICQITVLPYFGTATPSSTLEPTPNFDATRYFYNTDADAISFTSPLYPTSLNFPFNLNVYAVSPLDNRVYQVKVITTDSTIATLWFNARSGVDIPAACANAPTITPTPVATVTPVATATPVPTATPVAYTLADYGITVSGWLPAEEAIILEAVNDTARALHMISSQKSNRSQVDTFKIIMETPLIITKSTTQKGFCEMSSNVIPPTLICYGTLFQPDPDNPTSRPYTKFVFVHELGHRFDNRSRQNIPDEKLSLAGWISYPAQEPTNEASRSRVVMDCDKKTLFGLFSSNNIKHWTRGTRGWGSTANEKEFSDFQQNFVDSIGIADESKDVDEAAADMFLNWVYRRLTDIINSPPNWANACAGPIPVANEPWSGFKNIMGNKDIAGNNIVDPTQSGNVRYWWMEQVMRLIFQTKNW